MKNRKIIVAFILCACLVIGVAYAAIVDTLTISGKGTYTPSLGYVVKFSSVDELQNADVDILTDNQNAKMTVTLAGGSSSTAKTAVAILTITFDPQSSGVESIKLLDPGKITSSDARFAVTAKWYNHASDSGDVTLTTANNKIQIKVEVTTEQSAQFTGDVVNFDFAVPIQVDDGNV